MMWIDLRTIPEDQLTDWYRELLRRGWIWFIVNDPTPDNEEES